MLLDTAKRTAEKFKGTMEKLRTTRLTQTLQVLRVQSKVLKASLESFDNTKADAELDVDFSKVREEVNTAKGIVNSFDHLHADAELTADIKVLEQILNFLKNILIE